MMAKTKRVPCAKTKGYENMFVQVKASYLKGLAQGVFMTDDTEGADKGKIIENLI